MDGSAYAMEMHLVHFKSSFATIADSLADPQSDTLAVLGIFFQVSFKLRNILLLNTSASSTD